MLSLLTPAVLASRMGGAQVRSASAQGPSGPGRPCAPWHRVKGEAASAPGRALWAHSSFPSFQMVLLPTKDWCQGSQILSTPSYCLSDWKPGQEEKEGQVSPADHRDNLAAPNGPIWGSLLCEGEAGGMQGCPSSGQHNTLR